MTPGHTPATGDAPAAGRLRTLAVVHVAWAAFGVVGLAVTAVYGWTIWPMGADGAPEELARLGATVAAIAEAFMRLAKAWVFVIVAFQLAMMALNVFVARWLAQRRRWFLCAAVSGINCLRLPLGPVVGVPTLVVLNEPGVRASFA